jgi:hypothetical protein
MTVRSSIDAEVLWNGIRVAKIIDVQMDTQRTMAPTTALGEADETVLKMGRRTPGSGTLLYDPEDAATISLVESIYDDTTSEPLDVLTMVLDTKNGKFVRGNAAISSIQIGTRVGDLISVPVSFVISGKPERRH